MMFIWAKLLLACVSVCEQQVTNCKGRGLYADIKTNTERTSLRKVYGHVSIRMCVMY